MIENPSPEKKYRTRDGRKAEVYAVKEVQGSIFGSFQRGDGVWVYYAWKSDGTVNGINLPSDVDLVEIKEEVRYINFFVGRDGHVWCGGMIPALVGSNPSNHAGTVKLTFEDGKLISAEVIHQEQSKETEAAE